MSKEYKGISAAARALLRRDEGLEVDYKESLKGLKQDDLVAFANRAEGGALLVGVEEVTLDDGRQRGKPLGIAVGDAEKLVIVNKALDCIPPIQIEVFVENFSKAPFYRIEIAASTARPHCTAAGAYRIREDGRNRPLRPSEIAEILMEREATQFTKRFLEATEHLEGTLSEMLTTVHMVDSTVESGLSGLTSSVDQAASEASDASWNLTKVTRELRGVSAALPRIERRLAYLFDSLEVEDPVAEEARQQLQDELVDWFRENPEDLMAWVSGAAVSITSSHATQLTTKQIRKAVKSAQEIVSDEIDRDGKETSD